MPKVRRTERYEMPDTVDEIAESVRRILALDGVEHLSLNEGEKIYVERIVDQADTDDPEKALGVHLSLDDMLKRVVLDEYVPERGMSSKAQLFDMFMLISGTGDFFPTHVLCNNATRLARWLGMESILPKGYRLLHAGVHEIEMFPSDVVVVFGSARAGAPPADVRVALKLTLGVSNGQASETPFPVREDWRGPSGHDPVPREQGDPAQGSGPADTPKAPAWFGGG